MKLYIFRYILSTLILANRIMKGGEKVFSILSDGTSEM